MNKPLLPYDPNQQLLLPVALREWLPEDDLACFIPGVVDRLDLSEITSALSREGGVAHPAILG